MIFFFFSVCFYKTLGVGHPPEIPLPAMAIEKPLYLSFPLPPVQQDLQAKIDMAEIKKHLKSIFKHKV